ncbi:serine/threonine-protein kinase [Methanospirillum hungatei]|uniref:serine/threonine protein kinase n=1 Tax=Methanospirillum hungatei TaxID=2203 RepID=UPI0026EEC1F1|nr:serine/threonine-protein kinase [Methanospirillum hungatei]MCA1916633.1 serine/threonine protein kinase [Methanospirillum hungatei]
MNTTILPGPDISLRKKSRYMWGVLTIHLLLALQYLLVEFLFLSVPIKHGHGGGQGMGNAINVSLPSFSILFMLLILCHIISLIGARLSIRFIIGSGFGLVITATLTLGLLLFSRQSMNLLETVYAHAILVILSLVCSLLIGVYMVISEVRKGHRSEDKPPERDLSSFPLPMNRYRNVRPIGEGGVGTIWYAERMGDGRPVVVKVPRNDDEMTGLSFMQEISIWKDLEHPHIATLLSANILPVPYIEIEYFPQSVADLKTPVPTGQVLQIIQGLVSALLYAHGRGVTHCDIKPTNILLNHEGMVKLTDWGLARSGRDRWSVSGFSPTYAAPEQRSVYSECTAPTDIWQVGMVCAELLTGSPKIPSGTEPVFQTDEGVKLLPIILKCLAPDQAGRYQSIQELSDDLERIAS